MTTLTRNEAQAILKELGGLRISDLISPDLCSATIKLLQATDAADSWMAMVIQKLISLQKIEAIKNIRAATGFDLKTSKAIADTLICDLTEMGLIPQNDTRRAPIEAGEPLTVYNQLLVVAWQRRPLATTAVHW